jgi:hypothetical protein
MMATPVPVPPSREKQSRPGRVGTFVFDVDIAKVLNRPPWHVASTAEIAEATGIAFSRLANWVVRKRFVRPEPRSRYRLVGNRNLYRVDKVVSFFTGVPVDDQAHLYLQSVGVPPDGRDLWTHVQMLEGLNVFDHVWRPRDQEVYLAALGG